MVLKVEYALALILCEVGRGAAAVKVHDVDAAEIHHYGRKIPVAERAGYGVVSAVDGDDDDLAVLLDADAGLGRYV